MISILPWILKGALGIGAISGAGYAIKSLKDSWEGRISNQSTTYIREDHRENKVLLVECLTGKKLKGPRKKRKGLFRRKEK